MIFLFPVYIETFSIISFNMEAGSIKILVTYILKILNLDNTFNKTLILKKWI